MYNKTRENKYCQMIGSHFCEIYKYYAYVSEKNPTSYREWMWSSGLGRWT